MSNKDELKVDDCGCGHDHDHEHEHDTVSLTLDDGSELECPIIDVFEVEKQQYIALLHPVDEMALLYRFFDNEDGTIEVTAIESDEEFEKVSEFVNERMLEE
ncbi:MAG: DUF1292 domain-containing protein [Clostridiales bacterium]|nr:DUF1292 domain-containing protein [Clostridiales bacterium]